MPETASDSAIRYIRSMIFSGELGPGDRLPPERDLGARLGISRMTLRLALKALESTGYIVTTRGSHGGSRVAGAESLLECWNQWMRRHAGELNDLFEFRVTVETRLAALAAERRTDADLEAMERAIANEDQPQDWSSLFRTDMDIHRAIARSARSPRLEQAMLDARGDFFIPVDLRRLENQESEVHRTHASILKAIRAKDGDAAAREMRKHLAIIRELTDKALATSGLTPNGR
jgi:GntR family transcriptional regulator, transcriptional repressor for pyruvate dehydrogenase complex